jgi:hypothetical protein
MKIEGFALRETSDGGCLVLVDGQELPLAPSLKLRNHSPTGFCWGYSGSGPAQLALALLLWNGAGREEAAALYQSFKAQHVAGWPNGKDFSVELDVTAWRLGAQAARQALEQAPRMSER